MMSIDCSQTDLRAAFLYSCCTQLTYELFINEPHPYFPKMESLFLLVIPFSLFVNVDGLACSYHFPEYQNPQTCLEYDLTQLSHYGPYNITGSYYTYYVKVSNFASH